MTYAIVPLPWTSLCRLLRFLEEALRKISDGAAAGRDIHAPVSVRSSCDRTELYEEPIYPIAFTTHYRLFISVKDTA